MFIPCFEEDIPTLQKKQTVCHKNRSNKKNSGALWMILRSSQAATKYLYSDLHVHLLTGHPPQTCRWHQGCPPLSCSYHYRPSLHPTKGTCFTRHASNAGGNRVHSTWLWETLQTGEKRSQMNTKINVKLCTMTTTGRGG